MKFQGRTGVLRQECYGSVHYDPVMNGFRIRLDDSKNPEFWLEITLPTALLDEVRANEECGDDDEECGDDDEECGNDETSTKKPRWTEGTPFGIVRTGNLSDLDDPEALRNHEKAMQLFKE